MALALIGTLGTGELLIILFAALLMFGGRLPEVARSLGKSVNQFKRGLKDFDDELKREERPRYVPPAALPHETTGSSASAMTSTPTSTPTSAPTMAPIAAASTEEARSATTNPPDSAPSSAPSQGG